MATTDQLGIVGHGMKHNEELKIDPLFTSFFCLSIIWLVIATATTI